jgi:hypothetical protein
MENYWNSHNLKDAQELLTHIIAMILPNGGYSFGIRNSIALNEFINSVKADKLKLHIVLKSVKILNEKKLNSLEDFQKVYDEQLILYNKRPILKKKWLFYIPLFMEVNAKLPINISLLDHKMILTKSVPYRLRVLINPPLDIYTNWDDFVNTVRNKESIFLKLSEYGEDYNQAWLKLNLPFDVFRGLLEFSFNGFTFRLGGEGKPHSTIPHPQWMIIIDDLGRIDATKFVIDVYKPPEKYRLEKKEINLIKNNAKIIKRDIPNNSSINLLINSLRLYAESRDAIYPYHRFLSMWQIAEYLTLSNEFNGKSEKVAKRLGHFSKYVNLVGSGYLNILKSLSKKRNELVHQGISNIEDDDIIHLKMAIDAALIWYFRNAKKLKTKGHISNYFNLLEIGPKNVKILEESIKKMRGS